MNLEILPSIIRQQLLEDYYKRIVLFPWEFKELLEQAEEQDKQDILQFLKNNNEKLYKKAQEILK